MSLDSNIAQAQIHNASVPFLKLPTELLLLIGNELEISNSPLSFLFLRSTCKLLYQIIPSPLSQLPSYEWRRSAARQLYAQHLREQALTRLCALESKERRLHHFKGKPMVCSACVALHPSSFFFRAQYSIPPEKRVCKAHQGILNMCEHNQFTYREVRDLPIFWCAKTHGLEASVQNWNRTIYWKLEDRGSVYRKIGPQWEAERGCLLDLKRVKRAPDEVGRRVKVGINAREEGRRHRSERMWETNGGSKRREPKREIDGNPEGEECVVVLRHDYVLLQCPTSRVITNKQVGALISHQLKKSAGLCPHLGITEVLGLLAAQPYSDCPSLHIHGVRESMCPAPPPPPLRRRLFASSFEYLFAKAKKPRTVCGHQYHCPNPFCETKFTIYRARISNFQKGQGTRDEFVLTVHRNLGSLKDPTDPRWTSQLEEPTGKI